MSAITELATGTDFLGYRIEEEVARGGMGVVYRAYDRRLKRTVALKFVAPELARDERFRERFVREVEIAASLEHPNVVPIHDAGEDEGRVYLAMRYVEGTTLGALLRAEGPLEPARALAICSQVARALDAADERGLVHRDVKPSNVLLDASEHVYLADFGLSRRVDGGAPATDGRSLGTPAYVAPEQLAGEDVDGRVDVYSLGCLLFECLTGEPPFGRASPLAVAWAHLEDDPPNASERNALLPSDVDGVIRKALAKEPEGRYATCGALVAAAEAALGLRDAPRFPRAPVVAVLTVAVVAAAVALGVLALRRDGTSPPLFGKADTLVRVDPGRNTVTRMIPVGVRPAAVATSGAHVWVYNATADSVSEVDERTNRVERTIAVPARPDEVALSPIGGPVLAADAGGAWLIGEGDNGRHLLVHVPTGGGRAVAHRLPDKAVGVAIGFGAVWVVARPGRRSELLRIDETTGAVERRVPFPRRAPVDSVAVGLGHVWVVSSSAARLYRIDPRSPPNRPPAVASLADVSGRRPYLMRGFVWVGSEVFDPKTLRRREVCCRASNDGEEAGGFGSVWSVYKASGTLVRWRSDLGIAATTQVVAEPPAANGPCLTSVASGADAVWVTVAASSDSSCSLRTPRNGDWIAYSTAPGDQQSARTGVDESGHPYRAGSDVFLVRAGDKPSLVAGRGDGSMWNVCPEFSPDGTMLAFGTRSPSAQSVRIVGVSDTGAIIPPHIGLSVSQGRAAPCPRWSADGSRVAYVRGGAVVVRGLDGSAPRRRAGDPTLADFKGRHLQSLVSPAGDRVVRLSGDTISSCTAVVTRPDGSDRRELNVAGCPYAVAGWSPDGQKVLLMVDVSNSFLADATRGAKFTMLAASVNPPYDVVPIVKAVRVNHARSWPGYHDVSWQPATQ